MALVAGVAKAPLDMVRISCRREIDGVTGVAICIMQLIIVVHVTLSAGQGCMRPGERKSATLMGESSSPLHPCDLVASGTVRGETCCDMGRRGGSRKGSRVATIAVGRRASVLFPPRVRVACLARNHAVHAQKREACRLMPLEHIRNVPRLL